jgi:hypothetical protein
MIELVDVSPTQAGARDVDVFFVREVRLVDVLVRHVVLVLEVVPRRIGPRQRRRTPPPRPPPRQRVSERRRADAPAAHRRRGGQRGRLQLGLHDIEEGAHPIHALLRRVGHVEQPLADLARHDHHLLGLRAHQLDDVACLLAHPRGLRQQRLRVGREAIHGLLQLEDRGAQRDRAGRHGHERDEADQQHDDLQRPARQVERRALGRHRERDDRVARHDGSLQERVERAGVHAGIVRGPARTVKQAMAPSSGGPRLDAAGPGHDPTAFV